MRSTSIPSSCEETITKSLQLTSKPISPLDEVFRVSFNYFTSDNP